MEFSQGDIIWVNLDPTKGTEIKKNRPCIVVSNNQYNHYFNIIMVIPISSASKYVELAKYKVSPLFMTIEKKHVHGTALLQHIRTIDPTKRTNGLVIDQLDQQECQSLMATIRQFI